MSDTRPEAMEAAAKAAAAERDAHDWDATHRYDKPVMDALAPFLPEDKAERRAYLVEVQRLAQVADRGRPFAARWSGYTFVSAVLSSQIAWLTPGFAEARHFQRYGQHLGGE